MDELGGGKAQFFERIGAASAEQNLGGVHKQFLVEGDPHAFLSRAPMIYAFYYDQGRREYEKTGANEAVLTTRDAEAFSVPGLRDRRRLAPARARDAGRAQPARGRGGVPRARRRRLPLPPALGLGP